MPRGRKKDFVLSTEAKEALEKAGFSGPVTMTPKKARQPRMASKTTAPKARVPKRVLNALNSAIVRLNTAAKFLNDQK